MKTHRELGVTLIELVIVMVLVSILAAMMVIFVIPLLSYGDTKRRAEMTDIADSALRRMGRDLRAALPNSVRVLNSNSTVELLSVRTGGRYRVDASGGSSSCGGAGDALTFNASDTCFESIGTVPNIPSAAEINAGTYYVVVNNLQPGTAQADAYENCTGSASGCDMASLTNTTTSTKIVFSSNKFLYESPASRFFIIDGPVAYVCSPNSTDPASGTITRYSGYTIGANPTTGTGTLLVSGVKACAFNYEGFVIAQSQGLVTLALSLGSKDAKGTMETVSLYHTVHVSNVP